MCLEETREHSQWQFLLVVSAMYLQKEEELLQKRGCNSIAGSCLLYAVFVLLSGVGTCESSEGLGKMRIMKTAVSLVTLLYAQWWAQRTRQCQQASWYTKMMTMYDNQLSYPYNPILCTERKTRAMHKREEMCIDIIIMYWHIHYIWIIRAVQGVLVLHVACYMHIQCTVPRDLAVAILLFWLWPF